VQGQRKPERPAECKAVPARNSPCYVVRRSRCGFLTLLLSLYSRVLGSARVPRVGDGVPPSRAFSFLLSRKTVSARRRKSEPDWHYTRDACASRSTAAMRERIRMLPAGCQPLRASSLRSQELRSGRFGQTPLPKQRFPSRQQGLDKVLRNVVLQLTRRIPAPSPGESGRSKLCGREKGHGRA
jgi:hypothetical protein